MKEALKRIPMYLDLRLGAKSFVALLRSKLQCNEPLLHNMLRHGFFL